MTAREVQVSQPREGIVLLKVPDDEQAANIPWRVTQVQGDESGCNTGSHVLSWLGDDGDTSPESVGWQRVRDNSGA
jgi:hypothetical protein